MAKHGTDNPTERADRSAYLNARLRAMGQIIVSVAAALGVSLGTRQGDKAEIDVARTTITGLQEELRIHEEHCKADRKELTRILNVGRDGFRDPRLYHAVDVQIRGELKHYVPCREFQNWKARLAEQNPALKVPVGD